MASISFGACNSVYNYSPFKKAPIPPQKELKAYYALGFAFYKSKQWQNAKTAYETVLKLNPEDVYATKALHDINKYISSK